jgi:adenine-specific DNA-methyltransferase
MKSHEWKLPGAGPEREALRRKGQFWTPGWVAEAMVSYALAGGSRHLFDPAVGAGAFFRAAKSLGLAPVFVGAELDSEALRLARESGLSEADLAGVRVTDFVLRPPAGAFGATVGNPPYIRHHRLAPEVKAELKRLGASLIGMPLDGRAGLHVYFLLRALQLLAPGGRLAFIMPADTCEGTFASHLWEWVARNYRLDAVVTFAPEASPFPGVDTNPLIFFIRNETPARQFFWTKCLAPGTTQLKDWVLSGFARAGDALAVSRRQLDEALAVGLSREPAGEQSEGPTLGEFARIMRGIATGSNEFFFLTAARAAELELPGEFLLPAVGRTRDVSGELVTAETVAALERGGKPTLLFAPDGRRLEEFPPPVRDYLRRGEQLGLHERSLISTRRPWYKMERRAAPPILFAYLGRRDARFIRNLAGVVPLTGFLCVYPRRADAEHVERLWEVLRRPETRANLPLVGKSYGSGAIKVEPRALEKLALPASAVLRSGLGGAATKGVQQTLPLTHRA